MLPESSTRDDEYDPNDDWPEGPTHRLWLCPSRRDRSGLLAGSLGRHLALAKKKETPRRSRPMGGHVDRARRRRCASVGGGRRAYTTFRAGGTSHRGRLRGRTSRGRRHPDGVRRILRPKTPRPMPTRRRPRAFASAHKPRSPLATSSGFRASSVKCGRLRPLLAAEKPSPNLTTTELAATMVTIVGHRTSCRSQCP